MTDLAAALASRGRTGPRVRLALGLWLLALGAPRVAAQDASGEAAAQAAPPRPSPDGERPAVTGAAIEADPQVLHLRRSAERIAALLAGELDVRVDPADLFDVSLRDEAALAVEAERLRALLAQDAAQEAAAQAETARRERGRKRVAAPDPEVQDDGAAPAPLLAARLEARLELDRARLRFYELDKAERDALLAAHEERRRDAAEAAEMADITEAERKAREAERERQHALEAARAARTEAERLLAEERARLIGVASAQAALEAELGRAREELEQRANRTLGLQRRVREAVAADVAGGAADRLYHELRAWLQASRDELDRALAALAQREDAVPAPGPDRLADVAVDVDRASIRERRAELHANAERLRKLERGLREQRAGQLFEEVRALDRDRRALLPHLSHYERTAVTGFGVDGFKQAGAEVRQMVLVLRYRFAVTRAFIAGLTQPGMEGGRSAALASLVALKWLFALVGFVWWRRQAAPVLTRLRDRVRELDHETPAIRPSRVHALLSLLIRVRGTAEWLLFAFVLLWLLPDPAQRLLEVELVMAAVAWSLGGALSITTLDALAGHGIGPHAAGSGRLETGAVRLRSLRLVGITVVAFGLLLALTRQLVGRGTVYGWVSSTCWFAALPVSLVIVRWWRPIIFERVEQQRKKREFERWVMRNRFGWKSFPGAAAAGVHLFVQGSLRAMRNWVGRFDVTRRVLAYLFRRELDRMAEQRTSQRFTELPRATYEALGPETASAEPIAGSGDDRVARVVDHIRATGGGVFAVVGERGAGKTTVLRQVRDSLKHVLLVDCPEAGLAALQGELQRALGAGGDASLERCGALLDDGNDQAGVLIDDAQRLIQPVMGGLDAFDRLVAVARAHSRSCSWFFAIDEVIWRFLERARGARPLFDEVIRLAPWSEEEIASLLLARSKQAGISPKFDGLLEELPSDADELDRAEALERARAGYYRLLWDYSSGNPGVALHMWRRSLGLDAENEVCVKLFAAPDTRDLEQLPDPAVLVLRAVIQLDPARAEDVARATMLRASQVDDALRYAHARGYLEYAGDRHRVTATWFRAITRFLQRRHLLAAPK